MGTKYRYQWLGKAKIVFPLVNNEIADLDNGEELITEDIIAPVGPFRDLKFIEEIPEKSDETNSQ